VTGARKCRGGGQLTAVPSKFGAETRNCIWRLCHFSRYVL